VRRFGRAMAKAVLLFLESVARFAAMAALFILVILGWLRSIS
jgi:hypothetical protein